MLIYLYEINKQTIMTIAFQLHIFSICHLKECPASLNAITVSLYEYTASSAAADGVGALKSAA